jgi:hypothetical protein
MVIETAAIASAAKPLVEPFVEKFVTSKLQSFADWCKKKHKEVMIPTSEHFQEYLERSYNKYSIINTLVFHNSQRQLKDIYIAQTLIKENRSGDDEEKTKIEGLPVELIKKYQKILITDTAGMGKSTIMKRVFVDLIDKGLDIVGIPMYIELNKLNKDHTILTEIQEELNPLSEEFDKELLLKLIQTGGFIFFLDGFDEISIKDRNEVSLDVHTFISKAGNKNYFIMTSRPESGLTSFGDFQLFGIQPLTKDEAFELLKKYDISKRKVLSEKLIELLKSGQYITIEEYLVNPLLVSLLYTAYDYNQSIPFEKHRFYGVVFDAFFEKHDSSKPMKSRDKHSGLNHDGFDRILRYVGYKCLTSIGVKFDEDTILNTIRDARVFCGNIVFSESDFLNDLVTSVPLFCREGTSYKWVHKSLLEYFAARFIFCDAKQNQDKILTAIYNSDHIDKYSNMLDIYYDIDFKGFSKNIILPLCEQYLKFFRDNNYVSNIENKLVEIRIARLFIGNFAFINTKGDFNEAEKAFKQLRWKPYEIYQYYRLSCFYAREIGKAILLGLLSTKMSSLFYKLDYKYHDAWWDERVKAFESVMPNKLFVVDLNTGNESEEMYNVINFEMIGGCF